MLGEGVEQLCVFAVFAVTGVVLCACFVFCAGVFRTRLSACVSDAAVGLAALYAVWKINLELNNGEFRLYVFLGLAMGAVIAYFTCKRTLDKASALLYNWFTKLTADDNGQNFSQKGNIDTVLRGDIGTDIAGVHAVGNADAVVVAQQQNGTPANSHRQRATRQRRVAGTERLPANRRVRPQMGGRTR